MVEEYRSILETRTKNTSLGEVHAMEIQHDKENATQKNVPVYIIYLTTGNRSIIILELIFISRYFYFYFVSNYIAGNQCTGKDCGEICVYDAPDGMGVCDSGGRCSTNYNNLGCKENSEGKLLYLLSTTNKPLMLFISVRLSTIYDNVLL